MTEISDRLDVMTIEGKVVLTLEAALSEGPEAVFAKQVLTDLGHALCDQGRSDHLGEIMDRIVALDPGNAQRRHEVLEEAWESVGRESRDHE